VMAARDPSIDVILVGDQALLEKELARHRKKTGNITIVHASEWVEMSDKPVEAVRRKKDSSLLVGLRLVKNGDAEAFVSCGNTGAVMVAARVVLMTVRGVSRAALCQTMPTLKRPCVVLDLGANVDCNARQLCEFAEMGTVYARHVVGIENPRVGLLNIGEEEAKGSELSRRVHRELSAEPHVNFMGNVEPKVLFRGDCDVAVTDGFAGNVFLKSSEGAAMLITNLIRREAKSTLLNKLGAVLMSGAFRNLRKRVDPNEQAGALLIGIRGLVYILHGASTAKGVENAIRGAELAARKDLNSYIRQGIEELRNTEARLEADTTEVEESTG